MLAWIEQGGTDFMDGGRPEPLEFTRRPFHWPDVVRSLGLASDARKLVLALIGLILTRVGFLVLDYAFRNPWSVTPPPISLATWGGTPTLSWLSETLTTAAWLVTEPSRLVIEPFLDLLRADTPGSRRLQAAASCLWVLSVWGLIGGAIARVAVVQATGNGQIGVLGALKFAARRWLPLVGAPIGPLLLAAIIAAPAVLGGLIHSLSHDSRFVASLLTPVALVSAGLLAFLLVASILAWPLMQLTVSAEGEDIFDSISRSFSYVNQRFVRYTTCLVLAWVIGSIGLCLVSWLATMVMTLSLNLLSVFARPGIFESVYTIEPFEIRSATPFWIGWLGFVGLIVQAWAYSYFWSALSVIYLLLRRDVDGTPWHDIYLEAHEADEFAPKPPTLEVESPSKPAPVPDI
jgi:hypothetical protein